MGIELWTKREHKMPDHVDKHGCRTLIQFDEWNPATPEEIKACHPRCGSCRHIFIYESHDAPPFCDNDASAIQYSNVNPDTDYCNHHEPKET